MGLLRRISTQFGKLEKFKSVQEAVYIFPFKKPE